MPRMRGATLDRKASRSGAAGSTCRVNALFRPSMISGAMVPVARISMLFKSSSSPADFGSGMLFCALQIVSAVGRPRFGFPKLHVMMAADREQGKPWMRRA